MPTYEYECKNCSKRFDKFQKITEEPLQECPYCSGEVYRVIGAGAGFIFKGSGFYTTDYRSDSYKKGAQAEKSGSSDSSSACAACPKGDSCSAKK